MWNAIAHIPASTAAFTGMTATLGLAIRALFKYPHLWRYLETRHRLRRDRGEKTKKRNMRSNKF